MSKIKIVDSIMGSGKTSWAIQYMKNAGSDQRFIYITPFLTEVDRIKNEVSNRRFFAPTNKGKGKLTNLKQLILNDCDIVSTHALFQKADEEIIQLIAASNYILILDEVMNVIEQLPLKKDDFNLLINNSMVKINQETGVVAWNEKNPYQETQYNELKVLSKTQNLIYFQDTVLFWTFPVSVFQSFKDGYVLPYLFQGQEQKYYYDMYNLKYEYKAVTLLDDGLYELIDHCKKAPYNKDKMRGLINIYNGKLNDIGNDKNSLSKSWYEKEQNKLLVEKMKRNLSTYFKNNVKTSSDLNMWTCFKDHQSKLKGKGYSKGFIPHNCRATNDYRKKESCAYTINRFMQPYKYQFFLSRGIEVDQDLWALSELIQWIWRSKIRNSESINLYIPSRRMRKLLEDYLKTEL